MKLTRIAGILATVILLAGALAQAATVTGTVTDKTTGKPAAGDVVELMEPMMGMSEVGSATTDAQGHYSLNEPGSVPYSDSGDAPGSRLLCLRAARRRAGRHLCL